MDKNKSLSRIGRRLLTKEPFYGLYSLMLQKYWTEKAGTAGVSKDGFKYSLVIAPSFWMAQARDENRLLILKHELLHIVLQHLEIRDNYTDKTLFNYAADIVVNQLIDPSWFDGLTIEPVTIDKYPGLYLEPNRGTRYYYDRLLQAEQSGDDDQFSEDIKNERNNQSIHNTWSEFDNMTPSEKKVMKSQSEYQVVEAAKNCKTRGTLPGEIRSLIDFILKKDPPKFNWKSYLRMFTGGSYKIYTKKTRRRDSRRFPGEPALKIKQKKRILVGIDTSGSVSNDELQEFLGEIHHIYKTGTEVTVVECDTQISHKQEINRKTFMGDIKIHGRGGTSFDPVVDYYNDNKRIYTCLIYFTDGEAPPPVNKLKGRMLWALSSTTNMDGYYIKDLPGPKIKLN